VVVVEAAVGLWGMEMLERLSSGTPRWERIPPLQEGLSKSVSGGCWQINLMAISEIRKGLIHRSMKFG